MKTRVSATVTTHKSWLPAFLISKVYIFLMYILYLYIYPYGYSTGTGHVPV